ncbi:cyclopropane-fatty-acyl-phospholipid synthase family protein [Brumicola blandensis]|uniref:Cyclopropane-fatty-acyl-phospholipid synthase family protein n=1 Tax=Brumicola blandensis TaxID=3075611 RepID=A0AAW8R3J0_9ALTE|nr:cyclopropane-fatty-acyl-phospholipid synthase family protein [Alteromonas sp. W409]MDT0583906.1 cyclopropane-fatty-acyl-phospholipid synthase family protein [Alteromonas sp. W409]
MSHGEQTLPNSDSMSFMDKTYRSLFVKALQNMPEGHLTLTENGHLVAQCGDPDQDLHAEVNIIDTRAYKKLLLGGSVASGETFTEGWWTTPNLTNVIRIFARNLSTLDEWENKFKWVTMPVMKVQHFMRRNSRDQAKKNISAHYDLGNKLYTKFLDDSMMYSAAIYPDANATLAEAQENKLRSICDKLQLTPSDHLIEIGTGWGGLAIFAAKHYGCRVTTTTISDEQYAYAQDWVAKEQLEDKITLLKKDYRLLEGKFDKLVSIEMIEAVGKAYLPNFFEKCSSLLKPQGLMVLQAITIDDRRYDSYSNSVDFIQKHIFPGGFLPSQLAINQFLKKNTDMNIRDLHDIGLDYAKTLRDWHTAFNENKQALEADGYDERFARMWQYYLNYCEGGFLERAISTVQLVLSKPHYRAELDRA